MRLVLDAEAVSALADRGHADRRVVRHQLSVAARLDREVCITEVTLAELYRGAARSRAVDAMLSRLGVDGVVTRVTDRSMARLVGSLLYEAGSGSAHLADAHVVAAAVEDGGGVVLTSDPDDVARLAAGSPKVAVLSLRAARRG